jgi:uncharacterized protein (DUF924 family)
MTGWSEDLLAFWFGELQPKQWFEKNDAVDSAIRDRFGSVLERVSSAFSIDAATRNSEVALAHAVLLDQLPRNMFRGSARAFESDGHALALARVAVDRGLDLGLAPLQRRFLYLPFEHSEQLADQERSVGLFTALGDAEALKYAIAHHVIISRFGRFPHRNDALGRSSTAEETAFLNEPMSSF